VNRRVDRAIALSALTAVALVPTVLVVGVQASEAPPKPAGPLPPPQAAAVFEPERARTPSPSPPAAPAALPQTPVQPPSGGGTAAPPPKPPKPLVLNGYVRNTDATMVRKAPYGFRRVTEHSRITMESAFAMRMRGAHEQKDALLDTRDPIEMTVAGRTMKAFNGDKWATTQLTRQDVATLKGGNEPRMLTFTVATLPGAKRSRPDAQGLTTFTGTTTFGKLLNFMPAVLLEDVYDAIPAKTPAHVTLKATKDGFPRTLTVRSTAATGNLRLTSTFTGYRLDR
jgi:hypothetical protein